MRLASARAAAGSDLGRERDGVMEMRKSLTEVGTDLVNKVLGRVYGLLDCYLSNCRRRLLACGNSLPNGWKIDHLSGDLGATSIGRCLETELHVNL